MKWLLVLSFFVVGCANDAPPSLPGTGTPVPPAMGTGGNGGTGGAGGIGGEGGAGGGAKGACDNESDLDALQSVDGSPRDIARDCGRTFKCANAIGITGQYGECVSDCVEENIEGLSMDCSACYGDLERCGLESFCRPQCQVNTCSTLCLDCLDLAGCIEEFEDCRGRPGDGCPDTIP